MIPSCDQIGVPIHFHSSTTSGSACSMSLRILARVSPRQSPSSAILFEMSSDADGPSLAFDFFMFSAQVGNRGQTPSKSGSDSFWIGVRFLLTALEIGTFRDSDPAKKESDPEWPGSGTAG